MKLKCNHCKHEWNYKGKSDYYVCCPICHYKMKKIRKENLELGICQLCGKRFQLLHIHHKIPIKKGGSNDKSNLIQVCSRCHRNLHNKKIKEEDNKKLEKPKK